MSKCVNTTAAPSMITNSKLNSISHFFQGQKANDFPLLIGECKAAYHYEGRTEGHQWNL